MKQNQQSLCNRTTFKSVDRELYVFANEIRAALKGSIDTATGSQSTRATDDERAVAIWAYTLGPLMWDVSHSVLLCLSHGDRRGPVILTRSIMDYQLRLRYYAIKPDKARQAIAQVQERFRVIMRADPTWRLDRDGEQIAATEAWLNELDSMEHESIKRDIFQTVLGDDAQAYYDGYYGKASALVHGYETVLRDVHRAGYNGEPPSIDFKGQVWKPNDCAGVLIHNLLDGLREVQRILDQPNTADDADDRWFALQQRLGLLPPIELMRSVLRSSRAHPRS